MRLILNEKLDGRDTPINGCVPGFFYKSKGQAPGVLIQNQLHMSASLEHAKFSLLGLENCCGDDLVDSEFEAAAECPIELIWLDSKAL